MILELLTDPLTWILALFVMICAWHNFRKGHQQGLLDGVDSTLAMLSYQGLIELEHGEDGEIIINAKDGKKFKTAKVVKE